MKLKVFIVSNAPPEVMAKIEKAFQPLLGEATPDPVTASCEGQMPSGFVGGGLPLDWTPPSPCNAQCSGPMQATPTPTPGPEPSREDDALRAEVRILRAKLQAAEAETRCANLRDANHHLIDDNHRLSEERQALEVELKKSLGTIEMLKAKPAKKGK